MSEFVEPEFATEEFLGKIDSGVFNAISEYDDTKRKYFDLAAKIRHDLPERDQFSEYFSGSASEVAYAFGEVALATYESYGLHCAKETMTDLWFYEQAERINFMGAIVSCSNTDCHEDYTREQIQKMVDEFFVDSLDEDELLDNAKNAYFEALESDAQSFVNHIVAIRNEPKSLLALLVPAALSERLSIDALRGKVAKRSGFALGISIGGAVVSKILGRKQ